MTIDASFYRLASYLLFLFRRFPSAPHLTAAAAECGEVWVRCSLFVTTPHTVKLELGWGWGWQAGTKTKAESPELSTELAATLVEMFPTTTYRVLGWMVRVSIVPGMGALYSTIISRFPLHINTSLHWPSAHFISVTSARAIGPL